MTPTSTAARPSNDTYGGWDLVRAVLLVGWIAVAVALPLSSERTSSWDHLKDLVTSGQVTQVHLANEMPQGATGFSTIDVRWSQGAWDYFTQVTQVRKDPRETGGDGMPIDGDADSGYRGGNERSTATVADPRAELEALHPGLVVTRIHARHAGTDFLGFAVPHWLTIAASLLGIAGIVTLVAGPQPWRATKWAWFWLITNPVTAFVFVLISGPAPLLPAPRNPNRRLTGGWAFLIMLVLTGSLTIKLGVD